ncbi:MAG: hypothetical protein JWN16_195 [Alphaproteobacteria bacterium]|nr:hypothetical protein [Alphaproteobacteria bacterium]
MTDPLPLSHPYNLARLGNAGDEVIFSADEAQRAAIAAWSGVLSLESLSVTVKLAKLGSVQFGLDFHVSAQLNQACVVTLEPVPASLDHSFHRELHFVGQSRRKASPESPPAIGEVVLDAASLEGPEEAAEEIESLHYDLAAPALEEYVLALEPYPRCPGVEFTPPDTGQDAPENPFAVLKGLKSGL